MPFNVLYGSRALSFRDKNDVVVQLDFFTCDIPLWNAGKEIRGILSAIIFHTRDDGFW
jgi:hypothetical protein